ncbi:MAG: AtpZ/AtpI family protein [Salinibacter sp.]
MEEIEEGEGFRSTEEPPSDDASAWRKALRDVAPYLDLGWRLAGTVSFPPILGALLDYWLQVAPWFLIGGCIVGFAGGILQLVRLQEEFDA